MRASRLARAGLAALSLALALVAAELVYRALDRGPYQPPEFRYPDGRSVPLSEIVHFLRSTGEGTLRTGPGSRMQPGLDVRCWYDRPRWPYFDPDGSVPLRTNSLGFRDEEFAIEKKPGELRVLAVGDSFTFGEGVRMEDAWPQVLERMLRASRGGPVEVINAGFASGSHWPIGYLPWIESDGVALRPDVLVLGFCLNDMGDVPLLSYPPAKPEPWLGGVSRMLASVQRTIEQRRIIESSWKDLSDVVRLAPEPWQRNREATAGIRDVLRREGIRFVVAVFPMISLLDDRYRYGELHRMLREFCATEGIEHVDLLDRFRGLEDSDLWVHPTDQHPNDVGHRVMAQGIFDYLSGG